MTINHKQIIQDATTELFELRKRRNHFREEQQRLFFKSTYINDCLITLNALIVAYERFIYGYQLKKDYLPKIINEG